ncbi:MAG: MbnP family protein [Flavobacteriales bacterium]
MKPIALLFAFSLVFFAGCKEDSDDIVVSETGIVKVNVSNMVDGASIVQNNFQYENALSETYSINLLKYYLSNAVLVDDQGTVIPFSNYTLIDGLNTSDNFFSACIPNGHYVQLKCYVGVNHQNNHSGDQEGDLDPINGMLWTWSTGYIFFKHEGQFIDSAGNTQELLYHFGTDAAYTEFVLPLDLTVSGNTKTVQLQFDLSSLYNATHQVGFENSNFHQSISVDDELWLEQLRDNFPDAFSITSIQ